MTENIKECRDEALVRALELVAPGDGREALSGVSCAFEKGGVHGVLGSCGSGRTLLLEVLSGYSTYTEGRILLKGEERSPAVPGIKAKIGYVPEEPEFYGSMTVLETMDFIGESRGVAADKRYRQIKEALELTGLEDRKNRLTEKLTKEEKKRLAFAGALLGNPEILYVDEPFPVKEASKREEFTALIALLGGVKTVIVASGELSTLRGLCEDVLILSEGTVLVQGSFREIEERLLRSRRLRVTTKGDAEALQSAVEQIPGVLDCTVEPTAEGELLLSVEHRADRDVREALTQQMGVMGLPILSLSVEKLSLESLYRSLTAARSDRSETSREVTK